MTAQAVADSVGGRLYGQGDLLLRRLRSLERAGPDELAVCLGPRYSRVLATSCAGAVLLPESLQESAGPATRIVVADPAQALIEAGRLLHPAVSGSPAIDATARVAAGTSIGESPRVGAYAVIGGGVTIGDRVRIAPHVVIEDGAVLGDDVRLDAGVTIYAGAVLGDRVWCKSGVVIGGDGFGFVPGVGGHRRTPQVGGCLIGDDVEIGSSSCVDRGSLDDTVIGRGTKIDNLVQIGHNVRMGEQCLVMSGASVGGSTLVGDRVVMAGQVGIAGHLSIGDDARIGAQAGVIASIAAKTDVSGFPARPHREFLRAVAALYRLTPLLPALEALAAAKERNDG